MEKFTKWADKSTHVNPFIPPRTSKGSAGVLVRMLGWLVGAALVLFKLPFMLLSLALLLLFSATTSPIAATTAGAGVLVYSTQGHPELQKAGLALLAWGSGLWVVQPLHRLATLLLLRSTVKLLLAVMGVSFVEQHANLRKLGLKQPGSKQPTGAVGATVHAKDVLLSNHTSALEVLYFSSRFLPLFTSFSIAPKVQFGSLSLAGALWRASHIPSKTITKGCDLSTLVSLAGRQRRPIVVFPEGVRSNGEGVLAFPKGVLEDLEGCQDSVRVHAFTFSGPSPSEAITSHTVGSAMVFLLGVLSRLRTRITVTYISAEDCPAFPQRANPSSAAKSTSGLPGTASAWTEQIRELMRLVINKPKLALGYEDFVTFNQYWRAVKVGNTAAADRLAATRAKL